MGGAHDIGPQDDVVEGLPADTDTSTVPPAAIVTVAVAPAGECTSTGWPGPVAPARRASSAARRTAASAQPAPRRSAETGGPATATSSTTRSGAAQDAACAQRARSGEPGVRPTRTTPDPSARTPAAIGGRLGP